MDFSDFICFKCRVPHLLRGERECVFFAGFGNQRMRRIVLACVLVHVAEDASESSYRNTRAYAYIYLWRRTCFFAMQHLKQGTGKQKKSLRHYYKVSRFHRRKIRRCHTYGHAVHIPAPVPQTSMLVLVGVAVACNVEFQGRGVRKC